VLSLLNILASCAVSNCIDPDTFEGSLPHILGVCVLVLLVIGLAVLINRNTRQ
jgi:hypothetical protein